jgi:hypothetical protein
MTRAVAYIRVMISQDPAVARCRVALPGRMRCGPRACVKLDKEEELALSAIRS